MAVKPGVVKEEFLPMQERNDMMMVRWTCNVTLDG